MIFADKILNLRKKAGLSQEELADKLGVSRQSVSKWEGAQSIPDINKIIEMSNLFGVSTDYLLKDDLEDPEYIQVEEEPSEDRKKVTMAMTSDYISIVEKTKLHIAFGVLLCILSPLVLLILSAYSELHHMNNGIMTIIGLIVLLLMVTVAVILFVLSGMKLKAYEFLGKKVFETEYGVTGLIREKKKNYQDTYNKLTIMGIALCILSVIPVFVSCFFENGKYAVFGVCGLLAICAIGVFMLVFSGCKMGAFNKILQEGDYIKERKNNSYLTDTISGAYWGIATVVYLLWSFISKQWNISWIVWVVAGILYPGLVMLLNLVTKKNRINK